MADPGFPPPGEPPAESSGQSTGAASGPARGDHRPLRPGGGRSLRRAYLILLGFSIVVLVIVLSFPLYVSASSMARDDTVIFLAASAVLAASSVFLVAAVIRGRAAIHGDAALVSGIRSSATLARVGGLVGWLGALVIVGIGVVQHYREVDLALVQGLVLGGVALVPALLNEVPQRIARIVAD